MTYRLLLAFFACSLTSTSFADDKFAASDFQLTSPAFNLVGSKVKTKKAGDLVLTSVSGNSQLSWQSADYGDVRVVANQIELKTKVTTARPNASATILSATCVGQCEITMDGIRCTSDQIEIRPGDQNRLTLSGDVTLTCGDTELTTNSCMIRFSDSSPTIIGEFRVPGYGR